jgi:hypothetical protein
VFRPDPVAQAELLKDPEVAAGVAKSLEPAVEAAKSFSPVDQGDYRDSIRISVTPDGVFLTATDWISHLIEFGTVHSPPFAPLRRGALAVGLEFIEDSVPAP